MRAVDIIQKKRDGFELRKEEIQWLIDGYVAGTVPDYQMSAFAMAIYFKGCLLYTSLGGDMSFDKFVIYPANAFKTAERLSLIHI